MKNPQIGRDGGRLWINDKDILHREDGPAVMDLDKYRAWYVNGELHRDDGPAQMFADGTNFWWMNGKEIDPIPNIICLLRRKLKQ